MARKDEKKTKKVPFDYLPDCVKRCIRGRKGCDETERKIKNSQWVKKINDDIKKLMDDVSYIRNQIKQQKNDDKEYTCARTGEIGLLTIQEAFRVQNVITGEDGKIGPLSLDIYGVDKYFGVKYSSCIDDIREIVKCCREYDISIDKGATRNTLREKARRIDELATAIVAEVYGFLVEHKILEKHIDVKNRDPEAVRPLMEGFRKTIHRIVTSKTT